MKPAADPISLPSRRLYGILVKQIYRRSTIGIVATVVNASILVFALWGRVSHRILLVWFGSFMLITSIRFVGIRLFNQMRVSEEDMRLWGALLIAGIAVSGILWGMTAVWLFPVHSTAHQAFIAFVLAGMTAGAVSVFSPILPAFVAFTLPALTPILMRFLLIGDELHLAMGAMTLLFAVLIFFTARDFNRSTIELILLKETFADQLEKRTAELKTANRHLRQEIQERRKAEAAMRQSEELLSLAAETASLGMWGWRLDQGELRANEKSIQLMGLSPQEIQNFSVDLWVSKVHPEDRKQVRERIEAHLKGEIERMENEYRIWNPQKGWIWLYANSQVIARDPAGAARYMVGVHYDITQRKQLEMERERLIADLEKALSEVKKLSGLLPICAVCKKIRDDKGYWNQIESYIRAHSDADFSHSICPECAKKMYPDFRVVDH